MKAKLLFLFLICFLTQQTSFAEGAAAGTPAPMPAGPIPGTRPRGNADPHKESSSFVGDPDSLDPMQVQKENLKEDEEPVLEDIRQVLDEPDKKAKQDEVPPPVITDPNAPKADATNGGEPAVKKAVTPKPKKVSHKLPKKIIKKPVVVVKKPKVHVKPTPIVHQPNLQSDDPDFGLEKKFHSIYNTYNSEPTSVEAWSAVLNNRKAQVYIVQKGDTLWSISKTLFGDPLFWPKIWSLNRQGIVNPHFITPGLQVMFYSGSEENIPSLAVGAKVKTDKSGEAASTEEGVEPALTTLDTSVPAGVIPDSLPLSRNDNYFLPNKNIKIDLQNDVEVPETYESDILLTKAFIKTEIEIAKDENGKGRCGGNHVIKGKLGAGSEPTFKIYEPLETLQTDIGKVFAYRMVGEATVTGVDKIKVTSCTTVMSPDLVFVSPKNVNDLRETRISKVQQPEIMGGPNLGTQSLFSNKQLIYINLGVQNVDVGQSVFVRSQLTEENSGEIKLLDKFGSFAIGILTEVDDLIEKGDLVTLQK